MREEIPGEDWLYRRIHRSRIRDGKVRASAYALNAGEDGLSVWWDRYSTPEDARRDARHPGDHGVYDLQCGEVRAIPGLAVEHDPQSEKLGHARIKGDLDEEARFHLARLGRPVPAPSTAQGG